MALILTYLLMNLLKTYTFYIFIDNFLFNKRLLDKVYIIAYGIFYFIAAFFYLSPIFSEKFYLILSIIFTLAIGFLYNTTNTKRLLCCAFINLLGSACDICIIAIITFVLRPSYAAFHSNSAITIFAMISSMLLFWGIVKLINLHFKPMEYELNAVTWIAIFLIPVTCIFILSSLFYQIFEDKRDVWIVLITLLTIFLINLIIFFLYNKLLREEAIRYDNMMLVKQNESFEKQALLIQDFQNDMISQRHDLKNYLVSIKEFAMCQDFDGLTRYIDHWTSDIVTIETGIQTRNSVVNAMINSKLYLAKLQSIDFNVDISIPGELDMINTDLTILLGNLLDNALEACTFVSPAERKIRCSIQFSHKVLSITVKNSYNNSAININNGKLNTTKNDKALHGIGLKQIHQVTKKYNGTFEYSMTTDLFIAEVILYLTGSC